MRNGFDLGSGDTVSRFTRAAKLAVSLHITKNIINYSLVCNGFLSEPF